jgi:hypothetical protein
MNDINLGDPMTLLAMAGVGLVIHRLVTNRWIWQTAARVPVSRQLPPGPRLGARRPIAARPSPRPMAAQNRIADYTTLFEGGRNPRTGMWDETIQTICR